ncbi:hypothetical protein BAUCODRAFT_333379 [Baudoinia panamericana UAMH 10762]|uniref:Uncharacterized protein n=1 Tax=Baudoinia panamericana (strain UAMH 10762) TaxID=717646 RepID=M2MXS4_BAUPA|nr:uncharacterized protein BAUCODRAFT_333379 [Baudoinia panamericana UAMH 10762]EMC91045.1 hypothetical protein BAUCODRAFT_333379 [Baudoinia panamericana UAMH 10762]
MEFYRAFKRALLGNIPVDRLSSAYEMGLYMRDTAYKDKVIKEALATLRAILNRTIDDSLTRSYMWQLCEAVLRDLESSRRIWPFAALLVTSQPEDVRERSGTFNTLSKWRWMAFCVQFDEDRERNGEELRANLRAGHRCRFHDHMLPETCYLRSAPQPLPQALLLTEPDSVVYSPAWGIPAGVQGEKLDLTDFTDTVEDERFNCKAGELCDR